MQPVYYDMHIHTALSPCADDDMLPCDIAGMAILNKLDIIAITDHNSMANVRAVCTAAGEISAAQQLDRELIVLPGMEVTTAEEVHVLCLFEDTGSAYGFEEELSKAYTEIKNREDIFGKQLICDACDNITGVMDRMLIAPVDITFDNLFHLTKKYNGAFVPAHVDRTSFSVTSNLGFMPPDLEIATVEYTYRSSTDTDKVYDFNMFSAYKYVFSSDAHQLHIINEKNRFMMLPEISARAAIEYLRF